MSVLFIFVLERSTEHGLSQDSLELELGAICI